MREVTSMVANRRTSGTVCVEKHVFWMLNPKLLELHTQFESHKRTTTKNQNEIGSKDHMAGIFFPFFNLLVRYCPNNFKTHEDPWVGGVGVPPMQR